MLLSENNIKSELSYAYLHAVAARAGCSCHPPDRHCDAAGVDARINARERFSPDAMTQLVVNVQLKATSDQPPAEGDRIPFWLGAKNYDELRDRTCNLPFLLVAYFMPQEQESWLSCSEDALIARRCAYWLSLFGAPPGEASGKTVYIPRRNLLTSEALRVLMARFARGECLPYEP